MKKYDNTFKLGLDFRNMWKFAMKLYEGDAEKITKIHQIQAFFN